ncbi:MbtH family protein [Streptomyces sp. NPDC058486]|uniref:MbtH family protein n=1 Tax=unclassified Streptomyces TaxID=2593676 RepID=UPI003666E243
MTNPFDDADGTDEADGRFVVLANHEGRYSLWPARIDVPHGWTRVFGASDRASCLAHVEAHGRDMTAAAVGGRS